MPAFLCIVIRRIGQKAAGEIFHNRYILTDLGGVIFGIGLDDGDEGETDDLNLMARTQYELRWAQFAAESLTGFEQNEAPVEVQGTRKPQDT